MYLVSAVLPGLRSGISDSPLCIIAHVSGSLACYVASIAYVTIIPLVFSLVPAVGRWVSVIVG